MTRRARQGLYYLREAAALLHVSFVVFEKALYHPSLRPQLGPRVYRRRWGHPRRMRVLTEGDLEPLAEYLLAHGLAFRPMRAARQAFHAASRDPKSRRRRKLSSKIVPDDAVQRLTGPRPSPIRHPDE